MGDATGVLSALRAAFDRFFADFDAATRQVDGGWEVIGIHDAEALSESTAALTNAIGFAYLYLFASIGEVLSELPKGVTLLQAKSTDGSSKPIGAESVRVGRIPSTGVPRLLAALEKAREVVALPAAKQHQKQRWFRGDVISGESLSLLKSASKSLDLHLSTASAVRIDECASTATATNENPTLGGRSLETLLDRAGNVFSLARELAEAFNEQGQSRAVFYDLSLWQKHAPAFDAFCAALLDLRDAMQNAPDGFAPVADRLLQAAGIAKEIRNKLGRDGGFTDHLDAAVELKTVFHDGWEAVKQVSKARRRDDPFAFVDDARRAAAKPAFSLLDRFPATPAGHVAFLEIVRDEVRYAAEAKRQQLERGYPNATIESMVRGIYWAEAGARLAALVDLPDEAKAIAGDVLRRELTAGTVEQIDGLLTPAVNALRDAWERARVGALASKVAIVNTAGDLWKALSEGRQPCVTTSSISSRRGANTPIVTFPESADETKRRSLGRAMALIRAEGGDEASTMKKLIARVELQTDSDWASVINMPLAEFVAAATGSRGDGNLNSVKAGEGDLIEGLLAGPNDAELSDRELALLEAYLGQPISASAIQRERRASPLGESETWNRRNKLKLIRDFNRNVRAAASAASEAEPVADLGDSPTPRKAKRSTERGEGRAKLIAALTKHHKYAGGGCLNLEPIGNNELARLAEVDQATASSFFKQQFKGHGKYKAACADAAQLAAALKLLNGEFAPHLLYGKRPADEDDRDNE
ncbi:MAG: hypothetical protein DCC68_13350 [Planctomycetota bacterium]|nr:MAG: hypothetical protein DCC68_13350 [Planctomycetota bacterium]